MIYNAHSKTHFSNKTQYPFSTRAAHIQKLRTGPAKIRTKQHIIKFTYY